MKTIQIAPNIEDCKFEGHKITGTMNNIEITITIPEDIEIPEDETTKRIMLRNFREAIALCSKSHQIEWLLNEHWQVKGIKCNVETIK